MVFLYQILPGAADRSYGIHVAEMAGLPNECIQRARVLLHKLESGDHNLRREPASSAEPQQMEFFTQSPVIQELRDLHVESLTPLEALNKLAELKGRI